MDSKSQEWRDAADTLVEALARDNKYIVGDMLVIFLESSGYGLSNYTSLGGVFKRAAKRGILKRIDAGNKKALWLSNIHGRKTNYPVEVYVRGQLVHAGNATITTSVTEPYTVTFDEQPMPLIDPINPLGEIKS